MITAVEINYETKNIEITCKGHDLKLMTEEIVKYCEDMGIISEISYLELSDTLYAYVDFSIAQLHII